LDPHIIRLAYPWKYQIVGDDLSATRLKSAEQTESLLEELVESADDGAQLKISRNFNKPTDIVGCLVSLTVAEPDGIKVEVTVNGVDFPLFEFSNQMGHAMLDLTEVLEPSNLVEFTFQEPDFELEQFVGSVLEICDQTCLVILDKNR